MDLIILIIAIVYAIVKYTDKNGGGSKKRTSTGAGPTKEEWAQRVRQIRQEAAASGERSTAGSRGVINSAFGKSARNEGRAAEAEQARRNAAERKCPAGPRRYRERSACQPDTNSGGTTDIDLFALSLLT